MWKNTNATSVPYIRLLSCIFCFLLPVAGFTQAGNRIEAQVGKIRVKYNEIRSKELDKRNLQGSNVLYFDGGQLVRADFFDIEEEIRYDFYYDDNEDLFFAFSNDSRGVENRYYFYVEDNGLINVRIPLLIKWLDDEKKSIADSDARFEEKGLAILRKSLEAKSFKNIYSNNGELLDLNRIEKCRLIENEAIRIDSSRKQLLENVNLLEEDDENEFCVQEINKYCLEGEERMIYKVYVQSCDPGCMVISDTKEHEYFNDNDDLILVIFEKSTVAYSEEKILYNLNRVEVIQQNYIFYERGIEIGKKEVMKVNGYKVY